MGGLYLLRIKIPFTFQDMISCTEIEYGEDHKGYYKIKQEDG